MSRNVSAVEARRLTSVAIACTAHAGVLAAIHARTLPARAPAELSPADQEIAIVEDTSASPTPLSTPPTKDVTAEPVTSRAQAKAAPLGAIEASSLAPPSSATAPMASSSPEPSPSHWSFSPFAPNIDVHAAVTPDMVAPKRGNEPNTAAPAPRSTTGGVAESLAERDIAIGMGRAGAILTAAESLARSSDAPQEGGATFEVIVGADGAVSAQLLAADGDAAAWGRVARSLPASIDGRRVRVPPGARGWRAIVRVDASYKLPDGRTLRSTHGVRAGVTPSLIVEQAEGRREKSPGEGGGGPSDPKPVGGAVGTGHAPNTQGAALQGLAQRALPAPALSASGKVCSGTLALTPMGLSLGGGCSVENIGAKATRIVSGRIVSEGAI